MKKWIAAAAVGVAAAVVGLVTTAGAGTVAGSKHDFSTTGPNVSYRGTSDQTCIYCHTPHNANATVKPLWNKAITASTFTVYSSDTMNSTPTQPAGVSKMCLTCHDGTIGVDSYSKPTAVTGTPDLITGATLLGTDLSNDHPVSVAYTSGVNGLNTVASAATAGVVFYGSAGSETVECASCHNPHDNANTYFLRKSNAASALCLACHAK